MKLVHKILNIILTPLFRYLGYQKISNAEAGSRHYYFKEDLLSQFISIHKRFLKESGWLNSRISFCNDDLENQVPWFTYSAIHFLEKIDFQEKKILEFGSGASTIWFQRKGAHVVSFESDEIFLMEMKEKISTLSNIRIQEYPRLNNLEFGKFGIESKNELSKYNLENLDLQEFEKLICSNLDTDIVVIDGGPRQLIASYILKMQFLPSLVILDNTDRDDEKIVANIFKKSGYLEIPFHGLGPLNPYGWTTSIFVDGKKIYDFLTRI